MGIIMSTYLSIIYQPIIYPSVYLFIYQFISLCDIVIYVKKYIYLVFGPIPGTQLLNTL